MDNNMKSSSNHITSLEFSHYVLQRRMILRSSSLFKIKKASENTICFTIPDHKCVAVMDQELRKLKKIIKYDQQVLALDFMSLGNQKFIVTGGQKGNVIVRPFHEDFEESEFENENGDVWNFSVEADDESFVNDIIHLPSNPNIIINCFNNGSLALWGLASQRRLHTIKELHKKYTYKIRMHNSTTLLSCGADCAVVRTDLQKLQPIQTYEHPRPVWCAQKINETTFASVGLFRKVLIWDVRCGRSIQSCKLQSNESSFICLKQNRGQMVFGDGNMIKKWDRRCLKAELATSQLMIISAQSILLDGSSMLVCGRGTDICYYKSSPELKPLTLEQELSRSKILDIDQKMNEYQSEMVEQSEEQMIEQQVIESQVIEQQVMTNKKQPAVKKANKSLSEMVNIGPEELSRMLSMQNDIGQKKYQQQNQAQPLDSEKGSEKCSEKGSENGSKIEIEK